MNDDATRAAVQHTVQDDAGTAVTAYLLAGPLTFGGIGYALDAWLGTGFLVPVGVLVGLALALYVIWLRYGGSNTTGEAVPGTVEARPATPGSGPNSAPASRTTIEETT